MDQRLAAAEAALKAGRTDEAVQRLDSLLAEDPRQPVGVYQMLALQFYRQGRYADGAAWARKGLEVYPRNFDLWNMLGVLLRRLGRFDEAVPALNQALRLKPGSTSALVNLANAHLDSRNFAAAEPVLARLTRAEPKVSEHQRLLGRALAGIGRHDAALARLRQAILLDRANASAWVDLVGVLIDTRRFGEALEAVDRGRAALPGEPKLTEGRVIALRRLGRPEEALQALLEAVAADPRQAWAHYQLGQSYADVDRPRANEHFRQAAELAPDNLDYALSYAESLQRSRHGDEAAHIEAAYQAIRNVPGLAQATPRNKKIASEIFQRVGAYDRVAQLGSFDELGREFANAGLHAALMNQLSRVRSLEDRLDLVEHHRIWGRREEGFADANPIERRPPAGPRGKLRIGFMSSDLRRHPVGSFAKPLFEHYDRSRFEVYCYSYAQQAEPDSLQQWITAQVSEFRWRPGINDRDAAQMIADDQLDILIELGGSTYMNKLEVMAYKPAPLSASWLGYAHSAGLSTIDFLVVDPFMAPKEPGLLIEQPLMLPHCWYSLGSAFLPEPAVEPEAPVTRNGFVTFGTANNPYKYGPQVLRTWARILARTPGSRFLFIRPESGTPAFRENMIAAFAAEGVEPERILFEAVRGKHLPHYNRLDMSLDTFPQTGGTTTCESLWMGAPVVTLVGPALYERLSFSVLSNLGLQDLCADTLEAYEDVAVGLAGDPARIGELRRTLRARMQDSPIGRTREWATDFFDAVEKAVSARR